MRSVVRLIALLSVGAFVALTLRALPDRAECMAPGVRFQHAWIVAVHVAFTVAAIAAAFAFSRAPPWIAMAFLVVAHASASRGLERLELTYPNDRVHVVHLHGPWALMRTHAGEGTALRESIRFAR